MDCPSEENLIRTKLEGHSGLVGLDFDIPNRQLSVFHNGPIEPVEQAILSLDLGGRKLGTEPAGPSEFVEKAQQRKVLWAVLAINFAFFLIELTTGLLSKSMGLVADSLDMLADSFVYGLSLMAVGGTLSRKKRIARVAGYFQLALAILGFAEVLRRFFGVERLPDFTAMIGVSTAALLANAVCLVLLQMSKNKEEAHMQASLIFTSNDVIINLGVILAGLLVLVLNSGIPDLVVGSIVFILVMQGARRILRLGT